MKRAVVIVIALVVIVCVGGMVFLKVAARGFSAREEPTNIEKVVARTARRLAAPSGVKSMQNPQPSTPEILAEARAHWADHCATCHANNGSGETEIGRGLYPRAPDMRRQDTQDLTDGELFSIIENGIRLTGMPAWGGSKTSAESSWKLVRFIRHLPQISEEEEREMKKLNPKTLAELQEEKEEEEFLKGGDSHAKKSEHSQH